MTQEQLAYEYVKEFGSILPAKKGGTPYKGGFFGSEISKACRNLRKRKVFESKPDGRFTRFYLKGTVVIDSEKSVQQDCIDSVRKQIDNPHPIKGIIQGQLLPELSKHMD